MDIAIAIDIGTDGGMDPAAAARRARFGRLPERVRAEDLVEETPAASDDPARHAYDPERSWTTFSCLAADLGL